MLDDDALAPWIVRCPFGSKREREIQVERETHGKDSEKETVREKERRGRGRFTVETRLPSPKKNGARLSSFGEGDERGERSPSLSCSDWAMLALSIPFFLFFFSEKGGQNSPFIPH